jgi:hypothetical protein
MFRNKSAAYKTAHIFYSFPHNAPDRSAGVITHILHRKPASEGPAGVNLLVLHREGAPEGPQV